MLAHPPFCRSLLLLGSSLLVISCASKEKPLAARPSGGGGTITLLGVVVRPEPLDNVVRSEGTVLASESVDLVAEAAGRIEKLSFKEGAHVRKGALLVSINVDDLRAQLRKTELQIEMAADQEKRQKHLLEIEGISREQYDLSLNQVNIFKADRENLLAMIKKREVRAPFDGIAGLRMVSEGSYVSSATRIASMQKINPLKVDFAIPEKYARYVKIGEPVRFLNEDSHIDMKGTVYAVEPRIDPSTGTLQVRAMCDNRSETVFPGASVGIELRLSKIPDAIMVPTQAVVPVLKGQTVFIQKGGLAASIPVKTGIRTATSIQVTDGLAPGDTVIITGLMQIRPGMPVIVTVQ
jgi:membrane fusion protein (multidrug efflux system)